VAEPIREDTDDDQDLDFTPIRRTSTRRGKRRMSSSQKALGITIGAILHVGAVAILLWLIFGRGGKPAADEPAHAEAMAAKDTPRMAPPHHAPPEPAHVAPPRPSEPTPAAPQWNLPPVLPPAGMQPLIVEAATAPPAGGPLPPTLTPAVRDFEVKHDGPVYALAVLAGGKQLLSAGADRGIRVWDSAAGREVHRFPTSPATIRSLAVNSLGAVAASGGDDGVVRVWDVALAKEVLALSGHSGPVRGVAFSPNGRYVLSGSEDGSVRVWDLLTREAVRDLKYGQPVTCVAFGPDGRRALVGGDHGAVTVYDLEAAQPLHRLRFHIGTVTGVAFSPDGHKAVSVGDDKTMRFWDVVTGQPIRISDPNATGSYTHLRAGQPLTAVAFAGDGSWVVAAAGDSSIPVLTLTGRGRAFLRAPPRGTARALAVAPDGSAVFLGTDQGVVRRLDFQGGMEVVATTGRASAGPTSPATPSTMPPAPATTPAGPPPKWFADAGTGTVRSLAIAANGLLVTGGTDKTVRVWDADSGKEVNAFQGMTSLRSNVAVSRDGSTVLVGGNPPTPIGRITAGADHLVRAVSTKTGKATNVGIHNGPISCLALSANGRYALTGCEQTVHYWDVAAARQVRYYIGHGGVIKGVDIHPKQPKGASVATDGTIRVWDLNSTRLDRTITGIPGTPHGIAFSPDGKALLVYGPGVLGTWDAITGKPLQQFVLPTKRGLGTGSTVAACWAPDGSVVVAALGTVVVLDAATGAELAHFDGATGFLDTVGVSGDGRYVAAAGRGVWLWAPDKPLAPPAAGAAGKEPPAGKAGP
jgi:WD40 repeat protein